MHRAYCKFFKPVYIVASYALFSATSIYALQPIGDISQTPLELTPTVEPNIVILFDNSGSMDFEIMTADAHSSGLFFAPNPDGSSFGSTQPELQITHRADCALIVAAFGGYAYGVKSSINQYEPDASLGTDKANCYVAHEQAWRFRCASFNTLYYDPSKTYEPWPGLRSDDSPYPNASITAAPLDPFLLNSPTVDITSPDPAVTGINAFRYYTCSRDENGNFVQNTETVVDASYPNIQNFANWFSYHRSRHLRAKALFGQFIIGQDNTRIGLTQLNTFVPSLEVEEMNQSFDDEGAKRDLLSALYSLTPNMMTGSDFDDHYVETARYLGCKSNNIFSSSADCPAEASPAGTCQPNHIILASDGFLDEISFTGEDGIGDEDADSSNEFDGGAFVDASSEIFSGSFTFLRTFSDVAISFYKEDLHSGSPLSLEDDVAPTPADLNRYPFDENEPLEASDRLQQHIKAHVATFTVPLLDPEKSLLEFPQNSSLSAQTPFAWLSPIESDIGMLQSLVHAAYSGRGEYISVTDPLEGINSGVQTLTDLVAQGVGSTTPVAINTQGTSANLVIYRTFYDSSSSSGDLTAQEIIINSDGTLNIESNAEPTFLWSAAEQLDVLVGDNGASNSQRNIITYSIDASDGIDFEFDDLDPSQQTQLNQPMPGSLIIGEDRLEFLRGLTALEGTSFDAGQFRVRPETTSTGGGIVHNAKLGTIANAAPVFVG